MRIDPDIFRSVNSMFFDALSDAEIQRQKDIVLARDFHAGEHEARLTARLKAFLGEDIPFRMNVCTSVVTAVAERLSVTGFESNSKELIEWAEKVWKRNQLDARQEDVYENALRDGEYFLLVSWDDTKGREDTILHQRYTDVAQGGDSFGCWIEYREGDSNQEPLYGVKQWTEIDEETRQAYQRRTLYFPDRIEKYRRDSVGDWEPYQAEGDGGWPIPWVTKDGSPLGIAIIPFNNKGHACEAWDAFPMQRAINKTLIDLLASSDMTAFRIFYSLGFIPTSDGKPAQADGSNWLKIEPGIVVGTTKSRRDVEFGAIDPADLSELVDLTHQIVLWAAMVTNTPVSRFISTKLIASDATLKEQEGPLMSRATSRQKRFGVSWRAYFELVRKLNNTFGEETVDEQIDVDVIWGDTAARGESEKLDLLEKKRLIGVPLRQLWKEAGYDQRAIEEFESMTEVSDDGSNEPRDGDPGSESRDGRPGTAAS